jgi:hypothetical protein
MARRIPGARSAAVAPCRSDLQLAIRGQLAASMEIWAPPGAHEFVLRVTTSIERNREAIPLKFEVPATPQESNRLRADGIALVKTGASRSNPYRRYAALREQRHVGTANVGVVPCYLPRRSASMFIKENIMATTRYFTGTASDGTKYNFVEDCPSEPESCSYRLSRDGSYLKRLSATEFTIVRSGVHIRVQ